MNPSVVIQADELTTLEPYYVLCAWEQGRNQWGGGGRTNFERDAFYAKVK